MVSKCYEFPSKSHTWRGWLRKLAFDIFMIIFFVIAGFLVYQSVYIASMFIIFTLTSTIFHYQQSLNVLGVIAGSVTFLVNVLRTVNNNYLRLKMLVFEIIEEIHTEKMKEIEEAESQRTSSRMRLPSFRSFHKLIWNSPSGLPYIPKKIYREVVEETYPIGPERAKMVVKIIAMAVFVAYIHSVMRALKMTEDDTAFDIAQAVLTLVAVVLPSLIANLKSDEEEALETKRQKCFVRRKVEKFLEEHPKYYQCVPST